MSIWLCAYSGGVRSPERRYRCVGSNAGGLNDSNAVRSAAWRQRQRSRTVCGVQRGAVTEEPCGGAELCGGAASERSSVRCWSDRKFSLYKKKGVWV